MIHHHKTGEISPGMIITSGETLFEDQRKVIEEAFQCKVSDQYGCVEMCIFVGQCERGHYHYRPDYSIVEVIKPNGEVAEPGEEGDIVCTGFINPAMPLIRYRIGDKGLLASHKCSCGLNTPHFEKILGRMDDFILTPDGRHVGRLSPVLKGFPVKEAQYIQKRLDLVVVRLVKDAHFNSQTSKQLLKEIRKRLGDSIQIEFEFVDAITRGPGGKLRTVVSEISNGIRFNESKTGGFNVQNEL
jgi:phenylacetate-CoA ligase